ncbi:MAG: CHASE3 domain-containing protein [Caulobacterales bacterium]
MDAATTTSEKSDSRRFSLVRFALRYQRSLLAVAFILIFLAAVGTYFSVFRLAEANRWVLHTFTVRQQARAVVSDLQDAVIGQRSYLLTRNDSYLAPMTAAQHRLPEQMRELHHLTLDNPVQQARLAALEPELSAKLAELQRTVDLAREGKRNAAVSLMSSPESQQLLTDIRSRFDAFSQDELKLLQDRQAAAETLRNWRSFMVTLSLVAATALAGLLAWVNGRNLVALQNRTRQLEEEAQQRQKAEENLRQANKIEAVGQLTGGIAHDFNNILTIVIGNLDTIRRRLSDPAQTQGAENLVSVIQKPLSGAIHGARSAAQLTHRLLAFARRQPLAPSRVDVNRLIADMSELLNRTLGETIQVETVLAGGLWRTMADTNQLENALVNLSINARDAMPNGGKLTIETANTFLDDVYAGQFSDVTAGQYVLLSVTDTGNGMSKETLQKVFEPFFTTKPVGQGTGLGLAMVHGFIKQSGGHIRIYSEVGSGTTVNIYLPRLVEADTRASMPSASAAAEVVVTGATKGETVLLVEDNEGVREYARKALEELGYKVLESEDARSAMEIITSPERIDLLFTDVILVGGVNGRQLATQAAEYRPLMPVLFTTGYTRNAIIHHGRLDAGVHLLNKPYTQQDLAAKVRELIDAASKDAPVA